MSYPRSPFGALCAVLISLLTLISSHARSEAELVFRSGFESTSDFPSTRGEASRFLDQATFGGSDADIDALVTAGYRQWLDQQIAMPGSFVLPYMRAFEGITDPVAPIPFDIYKQAWFVRSLSAPDTLRQRVAFALSEIMVVSERGNSLANDGLALGAYYDILLRNAFGSYRQLLEDVTLSPAMGRYLSMYRNRKPDLANNIQADENYAREVMQLFSIGLVQLNVDGSPKLLNGQTIPTYDVDGVRGLARVFTGWACHCAPTQNCNGDPFVQELFTCSTEHPMVPFEAYHDRDAKRLLDGVMFPPNRDARIELESALDVVAAHPNVAPFISRQLIQKLVTSNPSAAYVARISAVFDNNGAGVRGDLAAVVRAILLDPEAREGHIRLPQTFGKVREPLLRLTRVLRSFDVTWDRDPLFSVEREIHERYNQSPLFSPSVFNFFSPNHAPGGAVANAGLVAPEMQITTADYAIKMTNDLAGRVYYSYRGGPMEGLDPGVRLIALDRWAQMIRPVAGSSSVPSAAIDRLLLRVGELLLGGPMPPALAARVRARVMSIPDSDPLRRVQNVIYLITTSPEYAVQR
jgi:uncharacterized protein (DUF1800 family)